MKGFLLDEDLPTRLKFSPGLPIVALSERRRNHLAVTVPILAEYGEFARRLAQRFPAVNRPPYRPAQGHGRAR